MLKEMIRDNPHAAFFLAGFLIFMFIILLALILDKIFPESKTSEKLEDIAYQIRDNFRIW